MADKNYGRKEDNYGTYEIWGKQRERTNKGTTVRDERNAKKYC